MRERVSQLEQIESVNRKKKYSKNIQKQQQQATARMNNNNWKKNEKEKSADKKTKYAYVATWKIFSKMLKKKRKKLNNQSSNIDKIHFYIHRLHYNVYYFTIQ